MAKRRTTRDFGFDPEQGPYHFYTATDGEGAVTAFECFAWDTDTANDAQPAPEPQPRAVLDAYRWSRIATAAAENFNERMRRAGLKTATWKKRTLLAQHFGKELTLLMWAVEDGDPTVIPNIIANWAGFAPEERWWLYTTVNATSGHPEHGRDRGWRKAIKIGMAENPTQDRAPSALVDMEPLPGFAKIEKTTQRKRSRSTVSPGQGQLPLDDQED